MFILKQFGLFMISNRVRNMAESATIAMAQAARELGAEGIDIVSLSLGEPDFNTPQYICDAATLAMNEGHTHYPPIAGYPDLRKAIAKKLKEENNIDCTENNIVVSTGAKQSIANAVLSLINPGDEVIILSPFWVSYKDIVEYAEGVPVIVQGTADNDFKATADDVKNAITSKTKLVMFSSPSNPAGSLFSEEELQAITDVTPDSVFFLADEIYEYINYKGKHFSIGSLPNAKNRTITINGFSKGFAMTGWRLGYLCAPLEIAKATTKIQGQFTSGANSVAQKAAVEAYSNKKKRDQVIVDSVKLFEERKVLMLTLLSEIPDLEVREPEGAFYLFPNFKKYLGTVSPKGMKIETTLDLSLFLLNEGHVSVVSGIAFGMPEHMRISFATSHEMITEGISRLKKSLSLLKK